MKPTYPSDDIFCVFALEMLYIWKNENINKVSLKYFKYLYDFLIIDI